MKLNRQALNKQIISYIKNELKKYNLKSRGSVSYKQIGQYFVYMSVGITGMKSESVKVLGYIKPLIIDDIFWEVFQMPSNSNKPLGLRANGAFKVDGLETFSKSIEYKVVENIDNISKELLFQCNEHLSNVVSQFEDFSDYLIFSESIEKQGLYDYSLVKMLLLINEKQYLAAKEMAVEQIANKKYGRFQNEGKYIYEHIVEYCDAHLRKKK